MATESSKKAVLRKRMKSLRDGLPIENRSEWSLRICTNIEKLCLSRRIRRIGAFWPFGSEVDLRPLVSSHPEWVFVFPRIISTHPPRMAWGSEPLEKGLFGLMEPVVAQRFTPPAQILLVPGLAFDDLGYRVGYGGGYYDALLDRLDDGMLTLGVAFSVQRVPEVPIGPSDQPVQGVVTEAGLQWAKGFIQNG
jgi:5-formyltetrahydrofolate cyclo-ligase